MDDNLYFKNKIRKFYYDRGRDFFWRKNQLNPYQTLILEVFLKKTRAETVDKYMRNFIATYYNNKILLNKSDQHLFEQISILGLGNQRVTDFKKISRFIHNQYDDKLPCVVDKILEIPHIGLYTAYATMCFGFNKRYPILDVNSNRIISRYFSLDINKDIRDNKELQRKAWELLPRRKTKEYNWGLLDLGALVCKKKPHCLDCPLRRKCDRQNVTDRQDLG